MILPAVTTHYSLLSGFIKPEEAARKCVELGYSHCLLSDDNLSGVVDFYVSMKKAGVTPIIGLRVGGGHLIAKTLTGYKQLIKNSSGEEVGGSAADLQFYGDDELALMEVRYPDQRDAILHRILLCSKYKTPMNKINSVDIGEDRRFFDSDDYYFKRIEYTNRQNEALLGELENYDILAKPKLPKVDCGDSSEAEFLTELCRKGWREKFSHLTGETKDLYVARVKEELGVINGFGLSGYFLIVQDIVNYVRNNGWLPGPGRGCFLPDTLVKMSDGFYCPISMIDIGDTIIDAFGNSQMVYDTLEYDVDEEMVELEFENGTVIRCTKDHKFLTRNRGWVEADNLTDYDDIVEV